MIQDVPLFAVDSPMVRPCIHACTYAGAGSVWRKLRPSSIPASIQVANKACIKCKCPCGDTTGRAWDDHEYCRLTGHPKYRECYRACMDGCSSAIRNDVQNKLAWSRKNSGRP
eukprot:GHVU01133977.1.p1 GENE.GHVU01133977.1~~GHVU01133977.1.p1  ORF type:complete len:113 (-),score=6.56 GHVU01133977.1:2490-2828(-)